MSDTNRFRIPRTYKTLLALTVVIGPIAWLMLTEDGRRRTDLMVLGFMGEPFVEMRLDSLSSAADEAQLREFLPGIRWQCRDEPGPFGERNCVAPIGAFNDTPAHYLVAWFERGGLSALKVSYRAAHHRWLRELTRGMLGVPTTPARGVLQWRTEGGLVLMSEDPAADGEGPSLMWLSAAQATKRLGG